MPVARAAERFQVSWPTANRWADRSRQLGAAGMADRSSRPHRQPNRTPQPTVRKIVHLRWKHKLGPVAIGDKIGLAASTGHAVLVRCRLNRLSAVDEVTGEPVRRYEHPYPGAMLHVDVKKLGNVPDGGGWRYVGRQQGETNRSTATGTGKPRNRHHNPLIGTAYVHTVIDDHSRVAYAEVHDDKTAVLRVLVPVPTQDRKGNGRGCDWTQEVTTGATAARHGHARQPRRRQPGPRWRRCRRPHRAPGPSDLTVVRSRKSG